MNKSFTFDERRLAIVCFNHVMSQWVWHTGKLTLKHDGREAAKKHVKRNCRWFGSMSPPPTNYRVSANQKGTAMVMHIDGEEAATLTWTRFVDFMEQNRSCPRTTAEVDKEELMSIFD